MGATTHIVMLQDRAHAPPSQDRQHQPAGTGRQMQRGMDRRVRRHDTRLPEHPVIV